ncbi:coiled-coil domain-containing protein AGAP005037 isoform X2 [Bemisia tabaci]|uniref:coiled-coil domain-containing protein AGAP005037 isoform X2 n=1 Tax=Bemisia tabaci TaxID=7038 RepID=UPI003B288AD2
MASLALKVNTLPNEKKKKGIKNLLFPFTNSDVKSKNINSKAPKYEQSTSGEVASIASDGAYQITNQYSRNIYAYRTQNQPHVHSDNETIYGIAKPNFNRSLRDLKTSASNRRALDLAETNTNERRCSISSSVSTTSEIPSPERFTELQLSPNIPPYSQYYTTRNPTYSSSRPVIKSRGTNIPQRRSQQQIERDIHRSSNIYNSEANTVCNISVLPSKNVVSGTGDPRPKTELSESKSDLPSPSTAMYDIKDHKRTPRTNPIYNTYSALESSDPNYCYSKRIKDEANLNSGYFVRGSKHRNTTGSMNPPAKVLSKSMIPQHLLHTKEMKNQSNAPPIFKRGTLMGSEKNIQRNNSIKKNVSFSPGNDRIPLETSGNWPAGNSMKMPPPLRKSTAFVAGESVFFPPDSQSNPCRPLPSIPFRQQSFFKHSTHPGIRNMKNLAGKCQIQSESESGSEAGEFLFFPQDERSFPAKEEDWADGKGTTSADQSGNTNGRAEDTKRGSRSARREDPRRHTLLGDHENYSQQLTRSMDLEAAVPRGYPPPSSAMMFDEDPGIMSEVETSSTGFRRGNKQRSSLPVVRTPSKTLERPLGLVFLQYRSETKRALLPNEITSIDTVKALFVRSFSKQLTMEYLDSSLVKIYIHDSSKDMFYELEDLRSHLRDIKDRSVLRLFESADISGGVLPAGLSVVPPSWDQDQSYFSEPEFDSEYQHQHIHKTKGSKSNSGNHQPYYMTTPSLPGSSTLPRVGPLLRAYSPALPKSSSDRLHGDAGYLSSPERGGTIPPRAYTAGYVPSATATYEDPYYAQYGSRTGSITPVIDEETSDTELMDESYNLYGVKLAAGPVPPRSPFAPPAPVVPPYDVTRIRVEHMERQLANLTGLVQKALVQQTPTPAPRDLPPHSGSFRIASEEYDKHSSTHAAPSLPDKSVSFEKSVSFSDEPPDMNSPKQHSPQHGVDTKPTKSAIKSSTLPRMSSQERDRLKPAPPPKPVSISPGQYEGRSVYRDLQLTPEMYNQLRGFQKKVKDLKSEVRNLRRVSQAQAHSTRETIKDANIKIRAMLVSDSVWTVGSDTERLQVTREEDLYKQEMTHLETDLTELETTVEELRGNVINRKTRVNMSDVENMALILSKSSKTVADLKLRFPGLQDAMKSFLSQEMDKIVREETFLKEEPERLESALRRCKKLTGTLVTLKRLASVQEQRLPDTKLSPTADETLPTTPSSNKAIGARHVMGPPQSGNSRANSGRAENALDALLDELQTFSKQPPPTKDYSQPASVACAHSYPPEPKPPVPERSVELINKRVPPPPPPRTSSKSPLASPTTISPSSTVTTVTTCNVGGSSVHLKRNKPSRSSLKKTSSTSESAISNSSSCESVNSINSQDGTQSKSRQEELETRHQELLRKQKQLQEQYTRLQQLQRSGNSTSLTSPHQVAPDLLQLKKTGSESNLLQKFNFSLSVSPGLSGSLSQLAQVVTMQTTDGNKTEIDSVNSDINTPAKIGNRAVANKVYETDIL